MTTRERTGLLIGSVRGEAVTGRGKTKDSRQMLKNAEICARLPPPPVPPWLEGSPDRLHSLISNCSCWQKYSEICSLHVPHQYALSAPDNSQHSDDVALRLIPFVAAIVVGLGMLGLVAFTYFRHQRKHRSSLSKLADPIPPSRNYCTPNFYTTPSVTVETQLSQFALEDSPRTRTGPYSISRNDTTWPTAMDTPHPGTSFCYVTPDSSMYQSVSAASCSEDNEVLLQPDLLSDDQSEPSFSYNRPIYENTFNSTHSLPVDCTKEDHQINAQYITASHRGKQKRKNKDTRDSYYANSQGDINKGNKYFNFSTKPRKQSQPSTPAAVHSSHQLYQNTGSLPRTDSRNQINSNKGIVKKCKNAGHRVLDKLTRTPSTKKSGTLSTNPPNRSLARPFRALRRSLKRLPAIAHTRFHHHQQQQHSNCLDNSPTQRNHSFSVPVPEFDPSNNEML